MEKTVEHNGLETKFHVGINENSIVLTLVVTNITDEPITSSSGMGTWSWISLKDADGVNRLESMGSTAAVTSWTIDPGTSLVSTRVTDTPQEATELWEDIGTFDSDELLLPKEYSELSDEDRKSHYLIPAVDIGSESETQLIAEGQVDLGGYGGTVELEFTPAELGEAFDTDELEIMEDPRGRAEVSIDWTAYDR